MTRGEFRAGLAPLLLALRAEFDAPTWTGLRPTSDKLRETIFNILLLGLLVYVWIMYAPQQAGGPVVYILVQGWTGVGTSTPQLVVQRRAAFMGMRFRIVGGWW